jgi:2-aminoadipate transaminase
LAGGLPGPDTFPVTEIAEAMADLLANESNRALQYSATEGYPPLRSLIGNWHGAAVDQVLITHGSQQALDLVVRAVVDPGEVVALADPGYVGAIQAFHLAGAALVAVPSDADGLIVDALAEQLRGGLRPALVYVVANFHNPTGTTLPAERRRALAALADRYGFLIVDDDPYGHLRWGGEMVAPVGSFTDRVVSLGTVSKLLCPGLRVGYAVAPPSLASSLAMLKQAADLQTSTLGQMAAYRVLAAPGFLPRHLGRIRPRYQERAAVLVEALTHQLGDAASFRRPEGGMFIWVRLEGSDLDTHALLPGAIANGVAYVPGRAFGIDDQHPRALRLSFASASPTELVEGIARLAASIPSLAPRVTSGAPSSRR